MRKAAVLLVDDDPEVLRAVARDVRRQYGERYRVLQAGSGAEALDALRQLKLRGDPAALLLVDQRMPRMSGVAFLEQARRLFPQARRALLTAYADTDAAIRAINAAHVDYYLQKPWDPPEEKLYPILSEMLEEWEAGFRPPFEGVRVLGHRWSPESHRLKDFLARNLVPYQWLDVESNPQGMKLLEDTGLAGAGLPLVLLPDGSHVERATVHEVADRVGLRMRAEQKFYPLVIVGGGPAGLAAAVYAASEGVGTLLIEQDAPGGQAGQSSRIENYLGFPAGVSGSELARRATAQARKFGAEILSPQRVCGVRVEGPVRRLQLEHGSEVACHALLIATGVSYRRLDVPGADGLTGAGIYYGAAAAEARDCADEDVFTVGAGNSAGQAALHFAGYARKVTMLVRGASLAATMSRYLIDQIAATPNIEVRTRTELAQVRGDRHLEVIVLRDRDSGRTEEMVGNSVFVFIGAQPHTGWLEGVVHRDAHGFLLTGPELRADTGRPRGWPLDRDPFLLETIVPGIFAAGDVRRGSMKRVASGVGEGAMAVSFVHQYLAGL